MHSWRACVREKRHRGGCESGARLRLGRGECRAVGRAWPSSAAPPPQPCSRCPVARTDSLPTEHFHHSGKSGKRGEGFSESFFIFSFEKPLKKASGADKNGGRGVVAHSGGDGSRGFFLFFFFIGEPRGNVEATVPGIFRVLRSRRRVRDNGRARGMSARLGVVRRRGGAPRDVDRLLSRCFFIDRGGGACERYRADNGGWGVHPRPRPHPRGPRGCRGF